MKPCTPQQSDFVQHFGRVTSLIRDYANAETTQEIHLPESLPMPAGMEELLFGSMKRAGVRVPAGLLLAAATGQARLFVVVNPVLSSCGQRVFHRTLQAVYRQTIPEKAVTWIADGTADQITVESLLGRKVTDQTPCGKVVRRKPVVQIPQDVTRKAAPSKVAKLVQEIIAEYRPQQLGVICHRTHSDLVASLQKRDRRIVRATYFGQGQDRADNSWVQTCDLILVLGTPRTGPDAIRSELVRLGELEAAADIDNGSWGKTVWSGTSTDGSPVLTEGYRYHSEPWQRCFVGLCRAGLLQAIGRGRSILDSGVPVVVVSTEPGLDLPLKTDRVKLQGSTEKAQRVLKAVWELAGQKSAENPNKYLLENSADFAPVKTSALSAACQIPDRTIRDSLNLLRSLGLVTKVGSATGWLPVPQKGGAA